LGLAIRRVRPSAWGSNLRETRTAPASVDAVGMLVNAVMKKK